MIALIYVISPEGRVDEVYILYGHILAIGDICESWALGILVGALGIPLAADPELLPVV
jgi:hypothetical protein